MSNERKSNTQGISEDYGKEIEKEMKQVVSRPRCVLSSLGTPNNTSLIMLNLNIVSQKYIRFI